MSEELDSTAIRVLDPQQKPNRKKQAVLLVMTGPTTGQTVYLESKDSWKLGRAIESDISFQEESISRNHCRAYFNQPDQWVLEDLNSANGTWVNGERVTTTVLQSNDKIQLGSVILLKFVLQDELEATFQRELYESATKDALTGLHSKRYFTEQAEMEFTFHRRMKRPLSIVFLDIDHFKKVNDTYGHAAGDLVLKQMGGLLINVLRKGDVAGRYGGEELVFSLRDTPLPGARDFADRVRRLIETHAFIFEGKKIPVTASFGAATMSGTNFKSAAELMKSADEYLYKAKKGGRNRVACMIDS